MKLSLFSPSESKYPPLISYQRSRLRETWAPWKRGCDITFPLKSNLLASPSRLLQFMRNNNHRVQLGNISAGVFPIRSTRFSISPTIHVAMQYLIAKVQPLRTLRYEVHVDPVSLWSYRLPFPPVRPWTTLSVFIFVLARIHKDKWAFMSGLINDQG